MIRVSRYSNSGPRLHRLLRSNCGQAVTRVSQSLDTSRFGRPLLVSPVLLLRYVRNSYSCRIPHIIKYNI